MRCRTDCSARRSLAFLIRRAQLQERGEWSVKDEECVHHIKAVQHAELRRMVAEEMSRVQSGEQVGVKGRVGSPSETCERGWRIGKPTYRTSS